MPLDIPDIRTIEERVRTDLKAQLLEGTPELRRGNLQVMSRVEAGAVNSIYGLARRLSLQLMPDTAESDFLKRHASIWGVRRKQPARAFGQAIFSGANGTLVPLDLELRGLNDERYVTTEEAYIQEGEAQVAIQAKQAGIRGNLPGGMKLYLHHYISGLKGHALSHGDIVGGADLETDESLRLRLLDRIQKPPKGGSGHDYVTWAKEAPGVTRAWAYPLRMGPGSVGVTFLMENKPGSPIPNAQEVQLVQDYLDDPARRPITATVNVFPCQAQPVDLNLRLIGVDTPTVRQAVQKSLENLFRAESEPEGVMLISHIRWAISQATGEYDHELISPVANITAGQAELLVLGQINWG